MPPKKKSGKKAAKGDDTKKPPAFQKSAVLCNALGPGPTYKLRSVVGYNDHCVSKYRNPAYSIAARQTGGEAGCDGPGPIYYAELPRAGGFTFGIAARGGTAECGPGPYLLPDPPRGPEFSIKWRTKLRGGRTSAGPYNLPSGLNGPQFTIGTRPMGGRCAEGPGPGPPYSIDLTKPRAPAFSLRFRQTDSGQCASPGPYNPSELSSSPKYSFGVKHSPCSPPYLTECDEIC